MKSALVAALIIAVLATAVSAKGLTTRITLRDTTLDTSIDISDPSVLGAFNVWAGPGTYSGGVEGTHGFIIDWAAGIARDRPNGLSGYEVMFYVRFANRPRKNSRMWCCMSVILRHGEDSCICQARRTSTMGATSRRSFGTTSKVIGSTRLKPGTMQ